jgi:hypothetical protein
MSSPIRPPGSPGSSPAGLGSVGETAPSSAPAKSQATSGSAGAAASSTTETSASPTADWLRRLDAGEVSKSQAVEGLVAQAVEASGGARLSAAQRNELAEVLRQTLLNDPALGALLGGD